MPTRPTSLMAALTALLLASAVEAAAPGARVVMPASGAVIDGLPIDQASRWEAEGTLLIGAMNQKPVDRLLGFSGAERAVTIEIRREPCPQLPPGSTVPWPTLGYAGLRTPLPERRALTSCKAPELMIELRFPAGTDSDDDALIAAADRWESVVAVLHASYGATRIDLAGATGARARLKLEAATDAGEVLARMSAPMTLRSGMVVERATDTMPWLVRDFGGHDVLALLAPTGAGLSFQLLPFGRRYDCEEALAAALKSQPPAPPGTALPKLPPGWQVARPVGNEGVAFCAAGTTGGIVAIGGARVPRDDWMPIAAPILGRIGEQIAR